MMSLEGAPVEQKESEKVKVQVTPEELAAINDPETTHVTMSSGGMTPEQRFVRTWKPGDTLYDGVVENAEKPREEEQQIIGDSTPRVYTKAEAMEKFNFESSPTE